LNDATLSIEQAKGNVIFCVHVVPDSCVMAYGCMYRTAACIALE